MQIRRRPPSPAVAVQELRYQVAVPDAAPRHILEEIVWHKEIEITQLREHQPLIELQKQVLDAPPPRDFAAALRHSQTTPAVIAEVKKASPSKGVLRADFDPVAIAQAYQQGGATCLSVLTDRKFFQGSFENLSQIRAAVELPLLCKDFLIYPYQIYLARIHGADAVLLIAAILSDVDLQYFLKITHALGMTALVEVHNLEELDRVLSLRDLSIVGINNRDLQTFSVDLHTTAELLSAKLSLLQERGILAVSESGLQTAEDLLHVARVGAKAVLIGESLIKQSDPGEALHQLLNPTST